MGRTQAAEYPTISDAQGLARGRERSYIRTRDRSVALTNTPGPFAGGVGTLGSLIHATRVRDRKGRDRRAEQTRTPGPGSFRIVPGLQNLPSTSAHSRVSSEAGTCPATPVASARTGEAGAFRLATRRARAVSAESPLSRGTRNHRPTPAVPQADVISRRIRPIELVNLCEQRQP